MYIIGFFLLLSACSNDTEVMQKVNPEGSAARLNDLSTSGSAGDK